MAKPSSLKWIAFCLLIFQASGHAIAARKSRLAEGKPYLSSTAVLLSELIKLIISIICFISTQERFDLGSFYNDILGPESDYIKMTIPAVLYFFQNIMNFVAINYLDPATFQITQQFKILTTAMFSVLMLNTKIPIHKWCYLMLILTGIILVQMNPSAQSSSSAKSGTLYGLLAVITACFTSGFAGIYFEKALKTRKNVSLFTRNIQLSLFSVIPGFIFAVCLVDGNKILKDGFFQGYTIYTWYSILFMSAGGLLVAFVVKYADSIHKVIATTISFLLSSFLSMYIFDFKIGYLFVIGAVTVMLGSWLYILSPNQGDDIPMFSPIGNTTYKRIHYEKE